MPARQLVRVFMAIAALFASSPGSGKPQTGEKEPQRGREWRRVSSLSHLEGQGQHFADTDLRAVRKRLFHVLLEALAVNPGAVSALVGDEELAGGGVAAEDQMLAGDF